LQTDYGQGLPQRTPAMLVNPSNPNAANDVSNVRAAAQTLGLQLKVLHVSNLHETEAAFSTMVEQRAGALLVGMSAFVGGLPWAGASLLRRHECSEKIIAFVQKVIGSTVACRTDRGRWGRRP
jgi:hypothetical protein